VKYSLEAVNRGLETSQAEGQSLEASLFGLCGGNRGQERGHAGLLAETPRPVPGALSLESIAMATAQQTIRSMQSLKEDFATAGSVAGLSGFAFARDPQRTAALRKTGGA